MNLMKIIKEWQIIVVILLVIMSFFAIHPNFKRGVIAKYVQEPASQSIESGVIIKNINGFKITSLADYYNAISNIFPGNTVRIVYEKEVFPYVYVRKEAYPFIATQKNNETFLGITPSEIPATNLNFGLEIVGGTKVLLAPEEKLSDNEIENVINVIRERLNIYGLKEIPVSYVKDFSGNQYIRIEFAGVSEEEVKDLLEREGKFEAKIGNKTVFTGEDILSVCLTPMQCVSRITPVPVSGGKTVWKFEFQLDISKEGAQRFANITKGLSRGECSFEGCYLNETIDFYIDGELIKGGSLKISLGLQGKEETSPVITGVRETRVEAQKEMKKLMAILQSRKLPVSLNTVRIETISPVLGREFATNIFFVFIISILAVDVVIALRYRKMRIVIPIILISLSEIFITIGVAAIIGWTLDIASIAGLIAGVGTGVDDQIVITDEILSGEKKKERLSVKRRIKNAFFVVIASFSVVFVSMLPLAFAGAGLLRGFAITTMICTSVGVLFTRPAYGRICEKILR